MKYHVLFLIVCICVSASSFSQETSPAVVSAGGGTAKGSSISLDWTLGEVATESIKSSRALYTQGFHQPVLAVERVKDEKGFVVKNYSLSVFPNPATSVLNIQLHFVPQTPLYVFLHDGCGKLLIRKEMPARSEMLQLNVSGYAQGAYYLQIQNADGSVLSSYNVIKTK